MRGGGRWIAPVDAAAGGTWVGASELGLVLCLLNLNEPSAGVRMGAERSRGGLIPALMELEGLQGLRAAIDAIDLDGMKPFRLLAAAVDEPAVVEVTWRGGRAEVRERGGPPICLASSGLGDSLVQCRLPLFERLVAAAPGPRVQDTFHRHRWPDRPELSVLMSREEARTVSITTVELRREAPGRARVSMRYEAILEGLAAPRVG